MTRYQLSIEAENLPRRFCFGCVRNPNPYAIVKVSGGPREGTVIGRTQPIEATAQPDWVECLFLDTGENLHGQEMRTSSLLSTSMTQSRD
jgi:hypothetical protein